MLLVTNVMFDFFGYEGMFFLTGAFGLIGIYRRTVGCSYLFSSLKVFTYRHGNHVLISAPHHFREVSFALRS